MINETISPYRSCARTRTCRVNMLIETEGGFDYSGADCVGWMKEAGFKDTYVEPLIGPDSMVVGIK